MNQPAPDFQDFQRAFARHLRDPHHAPRPAGIPARRAAIYGELLFNNICGFLDKCFPVSRAVLGEPRWRRLNRTFYRDWPLHTPWFRDIPREFVRYLETAEIATPRPAWLSELARYEWAELAVDIMETAIPEHDPQGDLLRGVPLLNPARLDLACAWPVQRIGPDYRPRQAQATHLVVYRDRSEYVRFSEISPVTASLLARLEENRETRASGEEILLALADALHHPAPQTLVDFGRAVLDDLRQQEIILGSQTL